MPDSSRRIPRLLCVGVLVFAALGLSGCAHDRHTGALIGAAVGATIGYVIANEHDDHRHHKHYDYSHKSKSTVYHYPPRRDPYCK